MQALDRALTTWRGQPLTEFSGYGFAQPVIARLTELHAAVTEDRFEARLALGDTGSIADLEHLVEAYPYRERLWGLLVQALYRAGRQADALAALRRVRARLAEDLGLEPGPELRRVERAVFDQSATLDAAPKAVAAGLIAREPQLRLIADRLAAAGRGQGGVVLIAGEAGIGKTCLAQAAADAAGVRVVWGRCVESGAVPAFWPWLQALRALGERAAGAAEPLTSGSGDSAADPDVALFDLHERVLRALSDEPVLVVLDDLHSADAASLRLLRHAARELHRRPMLVLATLRPEPGREPEQLADTLAALAREPGTERLRLPPFSRRDVAAYLGGGDPALAENLYRRTGGNPFYLGELLRLLDSEGLDQVPETVRDVIFRRVARLPEPTQELLRTASVLGRDVRLDVLAATAATPAEEVMARLAPALATGLLAETPTASTTASRTCWSATPCTPGSTGWRRRGCTCGRARRWNRPAATPPFRCWPTISPWPRPGRRSGQGGLLRGPGRPPGHRPAGLRRGRRTVGTGGRRVRHGRTGRTLRPPDRPGPGPPGDRRRHRRAHHPGPGHRPGREDRRPRRDGRGRDGLRRRDGVELALLRHRRRPHGRRPGGSAGGRAPRPPAGRAAGHAQPRTALRPRRAEGARHAAEAVAMACGTGEPVLRARTLNNYINASWVPGGEHERLAAAEEMLALPRLTRSTELVARIMRMVALLELGEVAEWHAELEHCRRLTAEVQQPDLLAMVWLAESTRAAMAGQWEESERFTDDYGQLLRRTTMWGLEDCRLSTLFTARRARGSAGELAADLAATAEDPVHAPMRPMAVLATIDAGDAGDGAAARRLTGRWAGWQPSDWSTGFVSAGWGMVAARLGVPDPQVMYDRLLPRGDELVVMGSQVVCWGVTHQILADLADVLGDRDLARDHAERALAAHERLGLTALTTPRTRLLSGQGDESA
ncbi:hypothetical protein Acor_01740 [Acrocarpospora corrugata]|uniref:Bacterial transcriptional activator domain-containing protein n=1 Tax=Acrocarpospora corrugata TaxID=35763 RepID=A0A5M3VSS1_9ACTN|nr:hypothetical protein Acor_01740 [Acrocarpospora corrugata]